MRLTSVRHNELHRFGVRVRVCGLRRRVRLGSYVGVFRVTIRGVVSDIGASFPRLRLEKACSARSSLVDDRVGSHASRPFRRRTSSETICLVFKTTVVALETIRAIGFGWGYGVALSSAESRTWTANCCVHGIDVGCSSNALCGRKHAATGS
jgi:hypothetical protein